MSDYYSFSTEYSMDEFYRAVMARDKTRVEQLKAKGITLTENVKWTLINGGGSMVSNKPASSFWYLYITDLEWIGAEGFVYISRTFYEEIGEPLFYSESLADSISKYRYKREVFTCLMECYNHKKFNKKRTMQALIRKDRIDLLELCINAGWLSQAKKRDEMIDYAQTNNRPECTAWLMDFKNRTADFATEREKAEKKMQRELNAAPDSVSEMKKIWSYKKQEDGTLIITSYKGNSLDVKIPSKIGKDTVTAIGEYALSAANPRATNQYKQIRKKITKITIPDTVNRIESCAFDECRTLKEINIPNGIAEIKPSTFARCMALNSIKIPDSVTVIGEHAFHQCEKLESVNIPNKVREIGNDAFTGCKILKSIELPDSLKSLGESVFLDCKSLERIKIPRGVTEIKFGTFSCCDNLQFVEIPDTMETIGGYAFRDCVNLKSVTLPNSVQTIDVYAFGWCGNLETIVLPPSIKQIKKPREKRETPGTIFHESPKVTAIVEPKSYAEKYCVKNNIPYKYKEDV